MSIRGKVFRFQDNVNTDEIIPARYLNTSEASELAAFVMEDIRPGFGKREDIKDGIFVAGENFGCGSSREHAPLAIKTAGISCIIARSFARIFLRNAINIGLPIVELKDTSGFDEKDRVEICLEAGTVFNHTKNRGLRFPPYPEFLQEIIDAGGWLKYAQKGK
ncbi:MAG: 3-isopropylmalate dehydratase small subunit [Candidatus Aminicenantes bacterium]|nr:3-isopropylmalate dehydratase small subunit [Candidatus Aminicenantes bacterium]